MTQSRSPEDQPVPHRLDEIPTQWSLLRLAHQTTDLSSTDARNALVLRYAGAIRHYVGALLHNDSDADEIAQEVIVRLLRGQFASATPDRGSFRRMLMVAAHNLVRTYWAKQKRQAEQIPHLPEIASAGEVTNLEDEEHRRCWKEAMLEMAWKSLEEYQNSHSGSIAYTLLRLRAEYPEEDSESLARRLGEKLRKVVRADAVRQQLRRARVRFVQGLLEEVARSLDDPNPQSVEEELIETGLMPYVEDLLPANWNQTGELKEHE